MLMLVLLLTWLFACDGVFTHTSYPSCPVLPRRGLVPLHTLSTGYQGTRLAFNHSVLDPRKNSRTKINPGANCTCNPFAFSAQGNKTLSIQTVLQNVRTGTGLDGQFILRCYMIYSGSLELCVEDPGFSEKELQDHLGGWEAEGSPLPSNFASSI